MSKNAWVAYQKQNGSTVFANDDWKATRYIAEACQFKKQSDATECAAGLMILNRQKWHVARWKDAVRW